MRYIPCLLVIVCACGARTGASLDEVPPARAFDEAPPAGGLDPNGAPVCQGSPGEPVVLGEANPFNNIAVDATHVYFAQTLPPNESPQSRLMRMPKAGGTPEPLYTGSYAEFVLSASHLFLVRRQEGVAGLAFELVRVPRAGGASEVVGQGSGETTSLAVAPDGSVLVTSQYGQGPKGLWRWRPGGALTHLFELTGAHEVTATAEAAYVVHDGTPNSKRALTRVSLADATAITLLDDAGYSSLLVLDGDELCSSGSYQIARYLLGPSTASGEKLAEGGQMGVLAVDERHVYFADGGSYNDDLPPPKPPNVPGSIRRVARRGGAVEVLVTEGRNVHALAVDDCHVYWTSHRGLVRMRKP